MNTTARYSPEVRERAVRLVLEQQSEYPLVVGGMGSIAEKIDCTQETLRQRTEGCQLLRFASDAVGQSGKRKGLTP